MKIRNIEIKAICNHPEEVRKILKQHNADFKGIDHQIDTYYKAKKGRLKHREGNIEHSLIYYNRPDTMKNKESKIILIKNPDKDIINILEASLEKFVIVDKKREIYFIDNIKFHIDKVKGLGSFIEIEARSEEEKIPKKTLMEQTKRFTKLFGIKDIDLIKESYSDLLK